MFAAILAKAYHGSFTEHTHLRLLINSMPFWPSRGGVETVTELLASALVRLGHEVCVATMTPGNDDGQAGYSVLRRPSFFQLLAAYRRSEGVVLMGNSVRLGWPMLVFRKPALMIHHMFPSGRRAGGLRSLISGRCLHAAPSEALKQALGFPCAVVPNPVDKSCFFERPDMESMRQPDRIIFVGRLIEEKGVDVLLDASERLLRDGVAFRLALVGEGPQCESLARRVQEQGLAGRVVFLGALSRDQIAGELRSSSVAVVPSLCEEAFGLTALEAVACGCAVIVSKSGGLPEAVGECGKVVDKGEPEGLADAVKELLSDPSARGRLLRAAPAHLQRHLPENVAGHYVRLLSSGRSLC